MFKSKKSEKEIENEIRDILIRTFVYKYEVEIHDFARSLEPYYFWTLDFFKKIGYNVEKAKEEMGASVVSQFFGELSVRKQQFERRGMEILASVNTVVRSIVNLLYDLREFDRRLNIYDDLSSSNSKEKMAARLTLKRVWMDEVDVRKGNASINAMTAQRGLEFATLRDAFMIISNLEEIEKMDLNDRVKNILRGRFEEYLKWEEASQKELGQRRKIELSYLKAQVESLRLYSKWAKPYLKAAQMIKFKEPDIHDAELIQAFDQNMIEIILRGTQAYSIKSFITPGGDPKSYKAPLIKKTTLPSLKESKVFSKEEMNRLSSKKGGPQALSVIEVRFKYRARPTLVAQSQQGGGGSYRQQGKINIEFIGYAMTPEEFNKLKKQEEMDAMKFIEGLTTESLEGMREELEKYLDEIEGLEKKDKKTRIPLLDRFLNPKGANVGISFQGFGKKILERRARELVKKETAQSLFTLYDIFKSAHRLKTFPYMPDFKPVPLTITKPPDQIEF